MTDLPELLLTEADMAINKLAAHKQANTLKPRRNRQAGQHKRRRK